MKNGAILVLLAAVLALGGNHLTGDVAAGLDLVAQTGAVVYEAGLHELA